MIEVYKIVNIYREALTSIAYGRNEKSCVIYKPNQWALPVYPGSYLFAYKDLQSAIRNIGNLGLSTRTIYKAMTDEAIDMGRVFADFFDESVERFWQFKQEVGRFPRVDEDVPLTHVPEGTVMCPRLMLYQEVAWRELRDK